MAKYGAQDRRDLAKKGHALPDGSFPIADEEDLHSAIRNVGRGNHPEVAKKHIIKRARALGLASVIPSKWVGPEKELAHFGVKGMKWGRRKAETPESRARLAASVARGEKSVRTADAFNSPNMAIGMKGANLALNIGGTALSLAMMRRTKAGPFKKVQVGLAAAGVVLTGVNMVSTARDIHDINNYKKSLEGKNGR